MNIFLIIAAAVLVLVFLFVFIRKRKKKSSCMVRTQNRHPSGLAIYHPKTKVKLRSALKETPKSKDKTQTTKRIAVIDFKGDIKASGRFELSQLFDEIYFNRECVSELVLKVESPGGGVAEYGFLYAELERLRLRCPELQITVCIDTVAASGGYLMSLAAHKIIAAPFAMVGSIGVVSFIPNVRKLLEKLNIQPRTFTAGKYKRTVNMFDEATPEEVEHYKEQLMLIHDQFKQALSKYRTHVDVEQVATGEAWLASTSVEKQLGLVDELRVSSDYLLDLNESFDLVFLSHDKEKRGLLGQIRKNIKDIKVFLQN